MLENAEGRVVLEKKEYERLLRKARKMDAFERAGVDNWEGVDFAIDTFYEMYPEYKDE